MYYQMKESHVVGLDLLTGRLPSNSTANMDGCCAFIIKAWFSLPHLFDEPAGCTAPLTQLAVSVITASSHIVVRHDSQRVLDHSQ
mmetsp:Transcript_22800/g.33818  ORF Transcript_22800/g.33818 Transcript_22800/m.33818 type:complete len:85 (-) Transcript_22800:70-324(-)